MERHRQPTNPRNPTWNDLVKLEPRLLGLLEEARQGQLDWHSGLRGSLSRLVGWGRAEKHPILSSSAAYDVAGETLLHAAGWRYKRPKRTAIPEARGSSNSRSQDRLTAPGRRSKPRSAKRCKPAKATSSGAANEPSKSVQPGKIVQSAGSSAPTPGRAA